MKNATPRSISFVGAIFLSVTVVFCGYLLLVLFHLKAGIETALLIFVITFLASYFIFSSLMERFIYRKIKLIYKTISTLKENKEQSLDKLDLKEDIIGNVSRDVVAWQQDQLDEIAQLKRMEAFRKEFIGNVSHELNTPLFNIQGYIHTLLEGGIDDSKVNRFYLERAAKSVERLILIVDDLEAISKLESGEFTLDQRMFDLQELTKDVFDSLELRAREKRISLRFKEGSTHSFFVFGDKERIRQVLVNLIENSVKYGKEGGLTTVDFHDMDQNVLVEITDNGIGIEPKHLPRLFERFYRVDKSRSRVQGGTGLGLSIVKHILEAHTQSIHVKSTFGSGTTFTFMLKKAS